MTYEGLFEKCNTLAEAKELKAKLLAEAPDDLRNLAVLSIEHAYKKRREEIRSQWKEHCFG